MHYADQVRKDEKRNSNTGFEDSINPLTMRIFAKILPLLVGVFLIALLSLNFVFKVRKGLTEIAVFSDSQRFVPRPPAIEASMENDEERDSLSIAKKMFRLYDEVETFVLFIGYPRSQHSLIGAILDAHPEIVIPHEYDLLTNLHRFESRRAANKNIQKYVLFNELRQTSETQALFGIRANRNNSLLGLREYTYNVPGQWQGGFDKKIKVIGDKKGGTTSMLLANPKNMESLEKIGQIVQIPMKFIHVTRNPFDNIATIMLRRKSSREKVRADGAEKVNETNALNSSINFYFRMAFANQRIKERYGDAVLDIPGHEMVLRPAETLHKLCDHLRVTCSDDFIKKCSSILYGSPSVTRNLVVWTKEQKARVTKMMKTVSFLKDYSFDKYPE